MKFAAWFIIPLLSIFDQFMARYAIDITEGGLIPDQWVSWGTWAPGARYFVLRLPSWEWGWMALPDKFGWLQRHLVYSTHSGWSIRAWSTK